MVIRGKLTGETFDIILLVSDCTVGTVSIGLGCVYEVMHCLSLDSPHFEMC